MSEKISILQKLVRLNWLLILIFSAVICSGWIMLYSAADGNLYPWAYKQIIRFSVLFPVMIIIALIPIRTISKIAYPAYFIVLITLISTEFFGTTAMGATRWIKIGPLNLQPSELMKICVVLALAKYFHQITHSKVKKIIYLIPPILIVFTPALFVLKQPDLGTSLIIIITGGMLFFASGVRLWKFVVVICMILAATPLIWSNMHSYQKKRVTTFLNPENDPMGGGYNLLQSKIAIGSGGFSGKGFLQGTQSQLSFLPEKQTDFIFTMLAEEFGFLGSVTLILFYFVIIAIGIFIAITAQSFFGKLLAMGLTNIFFLHVFINIGMVMGLMPIVGAPLPLLSYGGTIMMTMMVSFGLILNVQLHSDEMLENRKGRR